MEMTPDISRYLDLHRDLQTSPGTLSADVILEMLKIWKRMSDAERTALSRLYGYDTKEEEDG